MFIEVNLRPTPSLLAKAQEEKELNGPPLSPVLPLPQKLLAYIFSFLSFKDLGQVCLVNRSWKQSISLQFEEAKKVVSACFFLKDWDKYFQLEVPTFPNSLSDACIFSIMRATCPFDSSKKIWETHTLLEIPKNLTLETLVNLPPTSERQGKRWVRYVYPEYLNSNTKKSQWHVKPEDFEDTPVSDTYCVIVKNEVLAESREQSFEEQQSLVSTYKGYEVPTTMAAIAINIAKFIKSKEHQTRLYGDDPWTYTRCQEKVREISPFIVGAFTLEGLIVNPDILGRDTDIGIAPMRKLV